MSFTRAQQPEYRELLRRAFAAEARRGVVNPAADGAFDNWRAQLLQKVVGVTSSRDCNHVDHYDRVMLELAQLCCDEALIMKYAASVEGRLQHVLVEKRREFEQLRGQPVHDAYLLKLAFRKGSSLLNLADLPESALWRIVQALDANIRSLRKKAALLIN